METWALLFYILLYIIRGQKYFSLWPNGQKFLTAKIDEKSSWPKKWAKAHLFLGFDRVKTLLLTGFVGSLVKNPFIFIT